MGIDVRFIQQLPSSFIDQDTQNDQPGLFRFIRTADANHDGNLNRAEIRSALPREANQNEYNLDAMAQNAERDITQACEVIRNALQTGRINLNSHPLQFRLFEPRSTHSYRPEHQVPWTHPTIDINQNGEIDRNELLSELRNSVNPRFDLLETRLRSTANGLHQMESHPEHRGIMNLLNIGTWLPFQVIGASNVHSLHDQIRVYANARDEHRQVAIGHFMDDLREHPGHSVQDALGTLHATEAEILINDLQVQNWQSALNASTREGMIDAHLEMVETLMQGHFSTHTLSGGAYLDELFTTPWRSENYAMANDLVTALENSPNLSAEQRARVQNLRERIRSTNLAGILELPRPDSLNEIWDFTVSTAVEILILRGGFKIMKAGRLALGAALASRGLWAARIASFLGHVSAATETAAGVTTPAPGLIRRGISCAGRGLGFGLQTISVLAGVALATNVIQNPERHQNETDFSFQIPEVDTNNEWVNANLASLALAVYQAENPAE